MARRAVQRGGLARLLEQAEDLGSEGCMSAVLAPVSVGQRGCRVPPPGSTAALNLGSGADRHRHRVTTVACLFTAFEGRSNKQ